MTKAIVKKAKPKDYNYRIPFRSATICIVSCRSPLSDEELSIVQQAHEVARNYSEYPALFEIIDLIDRTYPDKKKSRKDHPIANKMVRLAYRHL